MSFNYKIQGSFLFSLIKESAVEQKILYFDEKGIQEAAEIFFDISCIQIPNYFKVVEQCETENENLNQFIKNKEDILKNIVLRLIQNEQKDTNGCSAEDFLKNFENDRLVSIIF